MRYSIGSYRNYPSGRAYRQARQEDAAYKILLELERNRYLRRLNAATYPIREVVNKMAEVWMRTSTRKRRRFGKPFPSLPGTLEGRHILPIVKVQRANGREVREVKDCFLEERFACRLRYELPGFWFTVKVVDDWLIVDKVTMTNKPTPDASV